MNNNSKVNLSNCIIFSIVSIFISYLLFQVLLVDWTSTTEAQVLIDKSLKLTPAYSGFSNPTGIAFLDNTAKNILVNEKNGFVRLILDGVVQPKPLAKFNVDPQNEHGLLGIQTLKVKQNLYVYVYLTENTTISENENSHILKNRVYKFNYQNNSLTNKTLILDLPATIPPFHVGGKLLIGKDQKLYVNIGDLTVIDANRSKLQNVKNGSDPNLTGSIFRVNPIDGSAPLDNPFIGSKIPNLDKVYAYGIRNSFGLTSDPITGTIWDTENGPYYNDELNIVYPGFNSGWREVMGPINLTWLNRYNINSSLDNLVEFPNSYYSDPLLSWLTPVGITDIEFIKSPLLGKGYENNLFVGDYKDGNLYFFKVNENRTGLAINDNILDSESKKSKYIAGKGFGGITDIESGPDQKIYLVDYKDGQIYTIS